MKLNDDLKRRLQKKYDPGTLVGFRYKEKDVVARTDKEGNAVVMFIGRKNEDGMIRGERYVRTLKYGTDGQVIKDHWELKGKAH